ncbi:MAG TPA: glycosyltransferase [Tepidisphaeraceae bacterium]|jgi:glycosyltransferase involved in cell wall biosynthesis/predicted metal-dependent phosphoesterase TrpH|nr:glycosyltransferase [Tepidisphaeraceae bacterium]
MQNNSSPVSSSATRRVDLHCHSSASNKPAEAMLGAIKCPECYSSPVEVHNQAKARGMHFVALTDHDSLDGVQQIVHLGDVLMGEEMTTWFPEDNCKLHLLVYGIGPAQHEALQAMARNIYDVATYIEANQIAHSVAHPLYRQNDRLERWHLERLLLLFKGFECLNGAHSSLHREAFEPVLDSLTEAHIQRLADKHNLPAKWPQPWVKSRTAGSDDHGLLNIGRAWTEFPEGTQTVADVLQCLREGRCAPGGEAGSSPKLAHTFYSVAVRYYGRSLLEPSGGTPNLAASLLQTFAGERRMPGKAEMASLVMRGKIKKWKGDLANRLRLNRPEVAQPAPAPIVQDANAIQPSVGPSSTPATTDPNSSTKLLQRLFLNSARERLSDHPDLRDALAKGLPPLGEHVPMFDFVNAVNRDVSRGIADYISTSLDKASFSGLFEGIGAIAAQQFVLSPYYFALFHQNKERHLLREITGRTACKSADQLKIGLFTDTLDETNGVARFIRDMAAKAQARGLQLHVHTSANDTHYHVPGRRNFKPLLSRPMPCYESLSLNLPPFLEVMEWADRQQFDAIHVSTPGPMGLCGWIVAKMLRVPLLGTYHTDFPAYVERLTGDHRVTEGATTYMQWMYRSMAGVFTRSKAYRFKLQDLGIADDKVLALPAAINTDTFNPAGRDINVWADLNVTQPKQLLYVGRISKEKNLPLLAEAFKRLCATRNDTALVIAGDGPYLDEMKQELIGLPVRFLGSCDDAKLVPLYSSADLFIFPSRTDTLGQVVMEAQACGLPTIVSNEGGPKESIEDGVTGVVVASDDANRWCQTIDELLTDDARRSRMARATVARTNRFSLDTTLDAFWAAHATAVSNCASHPDVAHDLPHVGGTLATGL